MRLFFMWFQCNATRDALAKALYCRTVATIVRRANSFRKPVGTMGSESTESHMEVSAYLTKGQINSEWIYDVIVSPKLPTKNYQDF